MDELIKMFKDANEQIKRLIEYYNAEFINGKMNNDKLILKTKSCGKAGCKFCPHGPYWYRAAFNKKTRKFMFQYIGSKLSKNKLKWYENENWDRIKFYDNESKRIREQKTKISSAIKVNKALRRSHANT